MTDIEKRRLIDLRYFINAWFNLLPHHETYEKAYEALEDIYEDYFGRRRYSCYDSFRVVKDRVMKRK